jgi:hypothetical protein
MYSRKRWDVFCVCLSENHGVCKLHTIYVLKDANTTGSIALMGFLFDNSSFGNYWWRKPEGELYLALHIEDLIRYKNIVRCVSLVVG